MNEDKVVFFGIDGGCLDAYYLAMESCRGAINEKVILSDSNNIKLPEGSIHYGGFSSIEGGRLSGAKFVYQCGNVENHVSRHLWYEKACKCGLQPLKSVSEDAYIHSTAKIGEGVLIYPGVKIMRNVIIGENVILLPNSVVNHGTDVVAYTIVNSGVIINGDVSIGRNCFIGAGVQIRERARIDNNITIGMGSLVLESILKSGIYYGRPIRP